MENKTKILIAVLGILFICLVTWVVRTTPDAPPPSDYIEPPNFIEYENNVIVEEKNGVKIWELTSDKIRIDTNAQIAELDNIKGKFFKEDGKVLELTAVKGYYDQNSQNIHLDGDIVMLDGEGGKLTSVHLDWVDAEGLLFATEDVKISKDDMRAFADRAESKDGFKKFSLKGNAHILKGVKEEPAENPAPTENNNSQ